LLLPVTRYKFINILPHQISYSMVEYYDFLSDKNLPKSASKQILLLFDSSIKLYVKRYSLY
ncbi:hypothetical protein, partial [Escherichia coli]|uniref:hypothetical protein n=1 Tax=Escherichia coli TaxID=562 RepID=UPI0021D66BED